jgi:hypothetical protein
VKLTNKPATRFVPTLTEVVRPGTVARDATVELERLSEEVLQEVRLKLEQQLRSTLHAMVEEELRKASSQWQRELESAVESALKREQGSESPGKT